MSSHVLTQWIEIVGGACLVWCAFVPESGRIRALWAKAILTLSGMICVALGMSQLLIDRRWLALEPNTVVFAKTIFHFVRGLILGFLLSLLCSGQLLGTRREPGVG